jgi:hypothetical protein
MLPPVRGLFEYWERKTGRAPQAAGANRVDRVILDALGLAIEQAELFFGGNPGFAEFQAWILETAGRPDAFRLARYNAWAEGAPAPEVVRQALRAIDETPPVLDPAELACWDEHGYAILHRAISREEATTAERFLWQAAGADSADPESWYGRRSHGIMVQRYQHPALEPARRSPRVHKAFAQLWGTADLWMTTDRLSFNPPERPGYQFPGPKLHWDVSLALPIPFATQGILYLTDTEAEQGALRVVPGFHRRIETWLRHLDGADPRRVDLSAEAMGIAAGAGDLVIWRHELLHGSGPNRASRPRMAQYVNMYPADFRENPVWI